MSGQHWENYDVKWETVHCYPRNVDRCCTWPDVVAGISARFSKFAFVLFCYITNHLMTGPFGNSEFCFPRISMFPWTSSRETLRFSRNKIHCSPQDQSLSVNYYNCYYYIPTLQYISFFQMITKSKECNDIHELCISQAEFERREKKKESIYGGAILNRRV